MLILTRGIGQRTIVTLEDGRQILFAIQDIRGNQARVGIEAPKSIAIVREEISFKPVENKH